MSLGLTRLLSINYLFNLDPGPFIPGLANILLAGFGLIIIIGLSIARVSKKQNDAPKRTLLRKIKNCLIWLGIFGVLLVFFREQSVTFLSAPFWLVIWFLGLLAWLTKILQYHYTRGKSRTAEIEQFKEKQKYLKPQ